MIISKTPFRISFAGGGSDLKSYYGNNQYGAVISTSIDKYMYIMLHKYFEDTIRLKYSKVEEVTNIADIAHPIVRECLKYQKINTGMEIASISDVPAGTGIGSSSSFTVALLHALHNFNGKEVSKHELGDLASYIEIDVLGEPIGKQDQFAASYGGLNYIRFNNNESVDIENINLDPVSINKLNKNTLIFYSGINRRASEILAIQNSSMNIKDNIDAVTNMVGLCDDLKQELDMGNIDSLGIILNDGWKIKRNLTDNVSNSLIDEYYDKAIESGALGGKLLGAGGGGFFLFYCDEDRHDDLRNSLGLRELVFNVENNGSAIIYNE